MGHLWDGRSSSMWKKWKLYFAKEQYLQSTWKPLKIHLPLSRRKIFLRFAQRTFLHFIIAYIYKDDNTLDKEVVAENGGDDEGMDKIELYF